METLQLALHLGYTAFQNRYSREFSSHPRAMKLTEARKDATAEEIMEEWYRGWDKAAEWEAMSEEDLNALQGITL